MKMIKLKTICIYQSALIHKHSTRLNDDCIDLFTNIVLFSNLWESIRDTIVYSGLSALFNIKRTIKDLI